MRIIVWALWLVLFLVLFAFAVNNTAPTDLHFFAGMATKAPLIALLLAFFIAGFAVGFIALMPAWVRQRVEIRRLRRLGTRPVDAGSGNAARNGTAGAGANAASSSATTAATTAATAAATNEVMQSVARGARATN